MTRRARQPPSSLAQGARWKCKYESLWATNHLEGEIDDNETGRAIAAVLPIFGKANIWGDEIYFEIPVTLSEEAGARAEVEVGTLAYWPPGNALCIFYGRTPVSTDDTPRAYSPVNKFGRILGDATELRRHAQRGKRTRRSGLT